MKLILSSTPHVDYGSWLSRDRAPQTVPYLPLGLLSLAAAVRAAGTSVDVFRLSSWWAENYNRDISIHATYNETAAKILAGAPDVIGFTTEYYSLHHVVAISRAIKGLAPQVTIVLGGPQATAADHAILDAFEQIDVIVRGEGEDTLPELLDALRGTRPLATVRGLTFRSSGRPARTAPRPLINDLDALPVPAYDLAPIAASDLVPVEAGRGCPFDCTFCSTNNFWHRRYRLKSPQRVCDELIQLRDHYGVSNFSLVHDCLTASRKEVLALCDEIDRRELKVSWGCSSRTDTMDVDLARRMAASGFTNVYFGMESGDEQTQKEINKNLDLERSFQLIRDIRALDIQVTTPFMVGFPGETRTQISRTFSAIHNALASDVFIAQIFATAPYGDTPLLSGRERELTFRGHFLDVPMLPADRSARDALMLRLPAVFSGHYRYATKDADHLVPGVDQFFPLMNEFRYSYLALCQLGQDPLSVYEHWIKWLEAPRVRCDKLVGCPNYGTFEEFREFLLALIEQFESTAPYLGELFRYECFRLSLTQNSTRADVVNPHLSVEKIRDDARLSLAPQVSILQSRYDLPDIITALTELRHPPLTPLAGALVLHVTAGRIVTFKANALAADLLTCAEAQLPVGGAVFRIASRVQHADKGSIESCRAACIEGIRELASHNLLLVDVHA